MPKKKRRSLLTQTELEKSKILKRLESDPDIVRVGVRTAEGNDAYRKRDQNTGEFEVLETDQIRLKKNGHPIVTTGKSGRKRNPENIPPISDAAENLQRLKELAIKNDSVLKSVRKSPDSVAVIDSLLEALAEETASIAFERKLAEANGKETSALSGRRVKALGALGQYFLERRKHFSQEVFDMDSPQFNALLGFIILTFKQAMEESNVKSEMVSIVMQRVGDLMNHESWGPRARRAMEKAIK